MRHKEACGLHQLSSNSVPGLITTDKPRYDFEFVLLFKWKLVNFNKKILELIGRLRTMSERPDDASNYVIIYIFIMNIMFLS